MTSENIDTALKLYDIRWRELLGTETYAGELLSTEIINALVDAAENHDDEEAFNVLKQLEQAERHRQKGRYFRYIGRVSYLELAHKDWGKVAVHRCNSCESTDCEDEACFYDDFYELCQGLVKGQAIVEDGVNYERDKDVPPLWNLWEHTRLDLLIGLNWHGTKKYDEKVKEYFEQLEGVGEYTGSGLTLTYLYPSLSPDSLGWKVWELRCEAKTLPAVSTMLAEMAYQINKGLK